MNLQKQVIYRKDYQAPNYWIKSMDMAFMVESDHTLVKSRITFKKNNDFTANHLFLDGVDLELISIHVDGTKPREFCTIMCTSYEIQIYDIVELIRINTPSRDCPFPSAIFFPHTQYTSQHQRRHPLGVTPQDKLLVRDIRAPRQCLRESPKHDDAVGLPLTRPI